MKLEDYATIEESVKLSGYSEHYLRKLVNLQKLEAFKVGTVWLISKESLKRYSAESKSKHKEDKRYGPREVD